MPFEASAMLYGEVEGFAIWNFCRRVADGRAGARSHTLLSDGGALRYGPPPEGRLILRAAAFIIVLKQSMETDPVTEDLKVIFASNLISLRTKMGMTQAELAEKINYSDKSVSKWERAESLPDVAVVKCMAEIFGVDVDYMLNTHDQWEPAPLKPGASHRKHTNAIIGVCIVGLWTLLLLLFVCFWIVGNTYWLILIAGVPASLVVALVLNSLWHGGRYNHLIVGLLILSVFGTVYYILRAYQPWQLVFVLVPAEILVALSARIRKYRKKP